jgi:folate-binding protein YgfZ
MTLTLNSTLPTYDNIPNAFAISLDQFGAISLCGEEQSKYLQGQVTCDVNALTNETLLHGAHCDAKGKVFSIFRLINRAGSHLLLQPTASIESSLAELKKFGVFAKVEITQTQQLTFNAVAGSEITQRLHEKYSELPNSINPVLQMGSTTLVYLAGKLERYLIIDNKENSDAFINNLNLPIYTQALWNLIEIKEGFPLLAKETVSAYVPQMLNLQAIHGISFTKGCYLGQETVARMQYLGKNKRALFSLTGQAGSVNPGDIIEKQLGENWRKAGDILAFYQADCGQSYVQAILANDIEDGTPLRIKHQEASQLSIAELPYTLS